MNHNLNNVGLSYIFSSTAINNNNDNNENALAGRKLPTFLKMGGAGVFS